MNGKQKDAFCIVGVGASAGGVPALMQLLEPIPSDLGMSFVLLLHLDPTVKSLLPETLAKTTSLPITEAKDGTRVKPNHIYTMPSESYLEITGDVLHLTPRTKRSGLQHPIDAFFQSLAQHHGQDAIGIVLSGTGNDGTAGIRAIKENGGRAYAQNDSAQFNGMPQSAIDSGSVDSILSPDEIIATLIKISHKTTNSTAKSKEDNTDTILALLKAKEGTDFLHYNQTSINRRIRRRMFLNHFETVRDYTEFLDNNPIEVKALTQRSAHSCHEFLSRNRPT